MIVKRFTERYMCGKGLYLDNGGRIGVSRNMDISIKCKVLKAIYGVKNGILRCVSPYEFIISQMPMIKVCIQEMGKRIITFTCKEEIEAGRLYSLLQELERLLQIFDGVFLDLETIEIYGKECINSYNAAVEHLKKQRLHYFSSANFISIFNDRLLKYEDILSAELFGKWKILLDELGVVNQMYLYATSSAGFTNDVKCAFLAELSESLMEIIQSEDIKLQRNSNREGKLKPCLRTIINCYGKTLFRNEIEFDLKKNLSCLVNTRVNIMHIKINQRKPALN